MHSTDAAAFPPVVYVVLDWCEIRNDALERWRSVLAEAAGTSPQRVMVSAVHQHEAQRAWLGVTEEPGALRGAVTGASQRRLYTGSNAASHQQSDAHAEVHSILFWRIVAGEPSCKRRNRKSGSDQRLLRSEFLVIASRPVTTSTAEDGSGTGTISR